MANNVEHLFMYLPTLCIAKVNVSMSLAHFLINFFKRLNFESYFYVLDTSPLSYTWFEKFFLLVCVLSFHPFRRVDLRVKSFNFDKVQFVKFSFYILCFGVKFNNTLVSAKSQGFSPLFFSTSFIVLNVHYITLSTLLFYGLSA